MADLDDMLPAELKGADRPAPDDLLDFLRMSGRAGGTPADIEEELAQSLALKKALSVVPRH